MNVRDIALPEGKSGDILFTDRLMATGLFKPNAHLAKGFGLRIRRSGDRILRSWVMQYRKSGRMRRMNIGSDTMTPTQALAQAIKLRNAIEVGEDPQADKIDRRHKDAVTLRSVITQFLEHKETDGVKQTTRVLLRHYLLGPDGARAKAQGMKPHLHGLYNVPVDQLTRKDISALLRSISKHSGPQTAIGVRSALSSMSSWAIQMDLMDENPIINAFSPKQPEPRDRVLTNAEIASIWKALDAYDHGKVVKLLLLTGCRRKEIAGMDRQEFSEDMSTWTLPKERSKNGKPHTLPITPLMREIIESIPRRFNIDVLFGRGKVGFTSWSVPKRELDKKLGFNKPWTYHDLRRSVATGMGNIGIQPHIIEAVLNHQSGSKRGIAGVYNRSIYAKEVNDAMLRWSDHIRMLIDGSEPKIRSIDIERKRRAK
jgi:integrase